MTGSHNSVFGGIRPIRLLDVDPNLADGLDEAAFAAARELAVAPALRLERGEWVPSLPDDARADGLIGLFVVSGLQIRSERLGVHPSAELIGEGDFLRPRETAHDETSSVPSHASWTVLEPTVLARLDRGFALRLARWPEIMSALFERTVERTRLLAFQMALTQVRRIDDRLLLLLWRLADRWGRVGPAGVVVPLRLTHESLSRMVGAQRPSVSTALGTLARDGRLLRQPTGAWLLRGSPPRLSCDSALPATLGSRSDGAQERRAPAAASGGTR